VASFVPELLNPEDPESVAQWARDVGDVVNGQLSIGEPISHDVALFPNPISHDVALFPNGVKGHMLGSFVNLVIGTGDLDANITCTHNLNIPNKGTGTGPTEMNVGWVPVRWEHNGTGVAGVVETVSCNYEDGAITADSIQLRFYAAAARTVNDANPLYVTLWFFPTTR
jgi:hypothetical protein